MKCHCRRVELSAGLPADDLGVTWDALLTLPNVPSAISSTTLYSPSFDGGKDSIGPSFDMAMAGVGRAGCRETTTTTAATTAKVRAEERWILLTCFEGDISKARGAEAVVRGNTIGCENMHG